MNWIVDQYQHYNRNLNTRGLQTAGKHLQDSYPSTTDPTYISHISYMHFHSLATNVHYNTQSHFWKPAQPFYIPEGVDPASPPLVCTRSGMAATYHVWSGGS